MFLPFQLYKLANTLLVAPRLCHQSDVPWSRMPIPAGSPFSGGSILMTSAPKYARYSPQTAQRELASSRRAPHRGRLDGRGDAIMCRLSPSGRVPPSRRTACTLLQSHSSVTKMQLRNVRYRLAQVPLPSCLRQEHFASTDDARLTIASSDLYPLSRLMMYWRRGAGCHQGHSRCTSRKIIPVPGGVWRAVRLRGFDVFNFCVGKVGFAFVIRIESVNFIISPVGERPYVSYAQP